MVSVITTVLLLTAVMATHGVQVSSEVNEFLNKLSKGIENHNLKNTNNDVARAAFTSGGVTYTRWGHRACPSVSGTQMLYTGRMAGVFYNVKGGGANYLCMPNNPQYYSHSTSTSHYSSLWGTEYEFPVIGTHNHNVPCAVCYASTRNAQVMIPARYSCPSGWTREYYGYLQSEANHSDRSRNEHVCVDKNQVSLYGSHANKNGNVIYHVRATCHGLQCPPYNTNSALSCAVCTK